MNVVAGAPIGHPMRDRIRAFIERHLPWWNPEHEERRNHASQQTLAYGRATRATATRTIRRRTLNDGYRAYGERVRR